MEFLDKNLGTIARFVITLALIAMTVWYLIEVSSRMDLAPSTDPETGALVFDAFQRSKDVLQIITPMLGVALGYWFGAAGKEKAEERADDATERADTNQDQLKAVLSVSTEPDIMEKARGAYPQVFTQEPTTR